MSNMNERVLELGDLFGIAFGMIVGAGVMTMTGIAIGITGKSTNVAYLIAALFSLISSFPPLLIGSTANFGGGQYSQISVLAGKRFEGGFIYLNIALILAYVLTSMSLAQYADSIFPGINQKLVSIGVITIFFYLQYRGVKGASGIQNTLVIILTWLSLHI